MKSLLLLHQTTLVVLVVVTGAMGAMWAYFWQQSSTESLRINSLLFETQNIRADLFRQLKEVTRARLMEDPAALNRYWNQLYLIDSRFYQLQQYATEGDETEAINAMRRSYEMMQSEMNKIFTDPYRISEAVRLKIIDPAYEEWMLGDFEKAFKAFSELIAQRNRALEERLAYWTGLAPVIIPVPIFLAALMLLYSHRILTHDFVLPMLEITDGAQKIRRGRLDHRIPARGVEEVTQLARSINEMAQDLTSSRDALIQTERQAALGALVPVVAHNIRNPLASIRAASQTLDQIDDTQELCETSQAIIDTVDRLERWVSALLSYLNPLKLNKRPARLSAVADGALAPLSTRLEDKALHVVRRNWMDTTQVHVDVDLMEQAIYGLLNNAIEASPRGSKISMILDNLDSKHTLLIDDQGPGMRFTPRPTHLSPGPSTKRFGTGLGIPFAFKVCQAHRGELGFLPAPGGGTRVSLSLPGTEPGQS
jgi:signal transduction histidine kinase